jgi:hypothetical protein
MKLLFLCSLTSLLPWSPRRLAVFRCQHSSLLPRTHTHVHTCALNTLENIHTHTHSHVRNHTGASLLHRVQPDPGGCRTLPPAQNTRVILQGCCKDAAGVQGCCKDIARMSQTLLKFSRDFERRSCCKNAAGTSAHSIDDCLS